MSNDIRNEGIWEGINLGRDFMKCRDFYGVIKQSDQEKKLPQPPINSEPKNETIEISAVFDDVITRHSYADLLDIRRSERVYDKNAPMTKDQLAFLLWSIQGVQEIRGANYAAMRPVPSGGARHPFETYFIARNVEGLEKGIYHYLPLLSIGEKRVVIERTGSLDDYESSISDMVERQKWAAAAAITVFITCTAYRAEWRYRNNAHRVMLIDLGHLGQNLMLSAEAMGLGSCCMAAYNQELCDRIFGLDGYEEYTVYACSVGKTATGK